MKTAYAITRGEYSDYRVGAICLTREVANAVAERANKIRTHDLWEVQRFPLMESVDDVTVEPVYVVEVKATTGEEERRWTYQAEAFEPVPKDGVRRVPLPGHVAIVAESTRGYDVALKAARDARTHRQADDAGLT